MIKQYKTFENLQQAKKILKDKNIDEKDPRFVKLRELLKNNLGYMGTFTKWMIEDHESFDKLEDIFKKLKSVNNLDKKVDEFKKAEDLYDYLQIFETDRTVKQILKSLPSKSRENADEKLIALLKMNLQHADAIKSLYKKKGGRYNPDHVHDNVVEKPNEFATYADWLYDDTKTLIKNLDGGFNSEAIKKKMKGLNVDIVEDRPDLLMLRIHDYEASKNLGSPHWCIVTSEHLFHSYVTPFTVQYFVYDFSKDVSDIRHMIGTTVAKGPRITHGHWADDSAMHDINYLKTI